MNDCREIKYLHGAVTSTNETSLAFPQDAQFWASNLSLYQVEGTTTIPTFNLDKDLDNFRPTCGIMNIEGGEYELIEKITQLTQLWQFPIHVSKLTRTIRTNPTSVIPYLRES